MYKKSLFLKTIILSCALTLAACDSTIETSQKSENIETEEAMIARAMGIHERRTEERRVGKAGRKREAP